MSGMCINFQRCETCRILKTCWILPKWLYAKYGREVTNLLEEIANREHEQWIGWMQYLFKECTWNKDGSITIAEELVKRWGRQMDTPYPDLPEDEKKSDIAEAEKVLEILGGHRHEFTKGVSIPGRDCGEILSILTVESAKILDARCPKCHKEFQKKGEEFNLEIGYTRQGEALSPLALSNLAGNGSFGLEKWLLGIKDEKAKKLLRDGIAFCDYLINQESGVSNEAAKSIRSRIKTLIDEDVVVSEQEARAMQAFFNSESAPMLRSVLAQQLSRERRKGGKIA